MSCLVLHFTVWHVLIFKAKNLVKFWFFDHVSNNWIYFFENRQFCGRLCLWRYCPYIGIKDRANVSIYKSMMIIWHSEKFRFIYRCHCFLSSLSMARHPCTWYRGGPMFIQQILQVLSFCVCVCVCVLFVFILDTQNNTIVYIDYINNGFSI